MYLLQNIGMGSDTNHSTIQWLPTSLFLGEGGQDMRLTTHFYLVLRLQMSGALLVVHSYDFMLRKWTPYFPFAYFSGGGMRFVPVVVL